MRIKYKLIKFDEQFRIDSKCYTTHKRVFERILVISI